MKARAGFKKWINEQPQNIWGMNHINRNSRQELMGIMNQKNKNEILIIKKSVWLCVIFTWGGAGGLSHYVNRLFGNNQIVRLTFIDDRRTNCDFRLIPGFCGCALQLNNVILKSNNKFTQQPMSKPNLLCMHNQIDVISPFIYLISFKLQFAHLIGKGREIVRQRRC